MEVLLTEPAGLVGGRGGWRIEMQRLVGVERTVGICGCADVSCESGRRVSFSGVGSWKCMGGVHVGNSSPERSAAE